MLRTMGEENISMSRTSAIFTSVAVSTLLVGTALAQTARDHLACFRVTDSAPKAKYRATFTTAAGDQTCVVKTPAKVACVEASKSDVSPTPPGGGPSGSAAGSFLCYQAKCPKPAASTNAQDQFGQRLITFRGAKLVCAPAAVAAPAPGAPTTTTTTVP